MTAPKYAGRPGPKFTDTADWHDLKFHLAIELQRRPATIATYATILDHWVRFLGRKRWQDATSRDLARFLDRPCGPGQVRAGQPLSDAARRHYTVGVRGLYRWAAAAERIDRDPMAAVATGRTPIPLPRDIPLADVRSLLVWVAGDDRTEVAVWLAYGCGLRVSEIAALRIEDVMLRGERPHIRVLDSKGGRSRVVPLPKAVREVLGGYLAQRPTTGPVLLRRHPADGRPMTSQTVSDCIRLAMKAAGIKARPHDLRHTYATQLLAAGKGRNLMAVSKLLGHASTAITEQVYGAGYRGEIDEAADLLPNPLDLRGNHA